MSKTGHWYVVPGANACTGDGQLRVMVASQTSHRALCYRVIVVLIAGRHSRPAVEEHCKIYDITVHWHLHTSDELSTLLVPSTPRVLKYAFLLARFHSGRLVC